MKVKQVPGPGRKFLEQAIKDFQRKQARVGFFEHSKYPDGTPAAYVATIQEFGYPEGGIPARPFFRPTLEEKREYFRNALLKGSKAVLAGKMTVAHMLEVFGGNAAGQIKIAISKVTEPPLSDATIASRQSRRKSPGVSTKPLVDTGYMISQVDSDVVDK